MNKKILIALLLGTAAASAHAGDRNRHRHDHDRGRDRGYAEVVYVEPIHERVRYSVPVEHCWDEERIVRAPSRHVIVGTLIGAAIGKHVGDAHGDRAIGTVGGALIGAAVGSNIARDRGDYRDGRREVVRRCETRHEERWDRQVVAYRVSYVYKGRRDVVRLAYDPGRWYRVG